MIPRLHRSDATKFDTLGYGALTHTISCIVTEELGVAPTLEMSVLMDDPIFVNVEVGNIITAIPNKRDNIQAFIIEEISKPIDGVVTIYATHIAQHRSKLIPVKPFTASNLDDALSKMVTNSMEDNPFTLVRDSGKNNVTATMSPTVPHSFRELMGGVSGSILDTYRGEWAYDNFTLTLYNKRGRDNGARVMYGRNMSDFTLEEQFNWDGSATGVIGYWVGETGTVISDIQYSDYKDLYPYNKTVCMDFSDKFEEQPTKAQLNAYAVEWINGKGLYGASVDVAYEHINVEGGADVGIGDVVHIYNGTYNFEMKSRIVGLEFDVLSEEYTNVTIGEQRTTLNEAISDTVTPQDNVESEILAKVAATYETKAEGSTHATKTEVANTYAVKPPVGSVVVTATNTNPSGNFGGTWSLIDKEFTHSYQTDTSLVTINSTNTTSISNFAMVRRGHEIFIRCSVVNKVVLNDNSFELLRISKGNLGVSDMYSVWGDIIGVSDGGNGICECNWAVSGNDLVLTSTDVITKSSGGTIAAGSTINFAFHSIPYTISTMLDSACNKFYWRRTA